MLFVFMAIFFVRNLMLPMVSDDIPYAFVWDGADRGNLLDGVGTRERITSFGDIVRSQYSHYMTWGGRIIGIGLTQFFSWQGKGIFNVLNPLVFTALALLVYRVGTGKRLRELNGVTAFSARPLFAIYNIGILFLIIAFLIAVYVVYSLISGHVVQGWASLMLSVWLVGGFILISLGIIGTYIAQIYTEVKERPLYHIQEILS